MHQIVILSLLLVSMTQVESTHLVRKRALTDILETATDFVEGPDSVMLKLFLKVFTTLTEDKEDSTSDDVNKKMEGLHTAISQLEQKIEFMGGELMQQLTAEAEAGELRKLYVLLDELERTYLEEFVPRFSSRSSYTDASINEYIEKYTSFQDGQIISKLRSIPSLVEIHSTAFNTRHSGLFDYMLLSYEQRNKSSQACGHDKSLHSEMREIYNGILEVMFMNYMGVYTALWARDRKLLHPNNGRKDRNYVAKWNNEWKLIVTNFERDVLYITEKALEGMKEASRIIVPCDADKWTNEGADANYATLHHFLTGLLTDIGVINDNSVRCWMRSCSNYPETKYYPHDEFRNDLLECKGTMYDCADTSLNTIAVNSRYNSGVEPRYYVLGDTKCLWIGREEDLITSTIGKDKIKEEDGNCEVKRGILHQAHEFTTYNINRCMPCYCICDSTEHPHTMRVFSHEMVSSKVSAGYVVYGVKIVPVKNGYGIAILQGKLENGIIKKDTLGEVRPNFDVKRTDNNTVTYKSRCVHLDDLVIPNNYVVTGVGFTKSGKCQGIKVQFTRITPEGNLITADSQIQEPPTFDREWISTSQLDESNLAPSPNKVMSVPSRSAVAFTYTSYDKDANQHVVPYLDTQKVQGIPPIPLSGVGLYYKAASGYGGFLGLRIFSMRFESGLDKNKLKQIYVDLLKETKLK